MGELYSELLESIVLHRYFGGLPALNYQWFFRSVRFNRYQQLADLRRLDCGFAPDRNIYGFWLASIISQNCQGSEVGPLVSFLKALESLIAEDKTTS